MKRMACLVVALGFSSPLFAQSSSSLLSVGDALQGAPSAFATTQPAPGVPPYAKRSASRVRGLASLC